MDDHTQQFQTFWDQRQKSLGNTPRSVLFKNLPTSINTAIHKRHVQFILNNIPESASSLLDVGCGYDRIAGEIQPERQNLKMHGIEFCEEFANKYSEHFGPCFHGSMLDYNSSETFDVILFVTTLMYIPREGTGQVIKKFWNLLNPGGILICIEPCLNFSIRFKQAITSQETHATYFKKQEIPDLVKTQPKAVLSELKSFGLIPFLNWPTLHYGLAFKNI